MKENKDLNITINPPIKMKWDTPFLNCLDITRTENGDTEDSSEGIWFFLIGGS